MKKEIIVRLTKYILDIMFFGGILITATLPWSIKFLAKYLPHLEIFYIEALIIYFILGIMAIIILRELQKIFKTVWNKNCFVTENVVSLNKMSRWSFLVAIMSVVRILVYFTTAMVVVVLVFIVAGLFSKVLACVFEEAIGYKE